MRLIDVRTLKLVEFFGQSIPPYAILSHTWGDDKDEVSFRDVEEGRIDNVASLPRKLAGCCSQAARDGLEYAWIDTCCIDKSNAVELNEAINSMFRWYARASVCYAYLSDVAGSENPRDSKSTFFSSRWFTRGWTLQELLAPNDLRFYDSTWSLLGTRRKLSSVVEKITGIPRPFLLGLASPNEASVAQRMSWAAKRITKREEDIAYCLLGIFGVMITPIYGEGDQAFSRLQEEIMKHTGDDSILAWALSSAESTQTDPTSLVLGNALALSPRDFSGCGRIAPRRQFSSMFDVSGGYLRVYLSLHTTPTGQTYGVLDCGPEQHQEQVVGIPLVNIASHGLSDEYYRPQGYHSVLLPRGAFDISRKLIHMHQVRSNRVHAAANRRFSFYIEEPFDTDLELIDVEPRACWQKDHSVIATDGADGSHIRQVLARFRSGNGSYPDFILVLEFEAHELQPQARCHLMISSGDTPLTLLSQKLIHIRKEAFGKQSASNGMLNMSATVQRESVAGQQMYVVRLAVMSSSPEVTVDATMESRLLDLVVLLGGIRQEEDAMRFQEQQLARKIEEKTAELNSMEKRLMMVEEKLRGLNEEKQWLIGESEKGSQQFDQLVAKRVEIRQRRGNLTQRLEELEHLPVLPKGNFDNRPVLRNEDPEPLLWGAVEGYETVVRLLLEKGADIESRGTDSQTPLICAAERGHEAVARLLLEKGADIESRDVHERTPLMYASGGGHEAVVRLLLEKGAYIESMAANSPTPLMYASGGGHEAVVRLLLEKGAIIESRDAHSQTPLIHASGGGHEAVVRLLLENGADIESRTGSSQTPLIYASARGHEAVVRLLLEKGAVIESKDAHSQTPLICAAGRGHEAVVRLLLENGAVIESKDSHSQTPLLHASGAGHEAVVRLLLEKDAYIGSSDKGGRTSLIYASVKGHEDVVRLLLEKGADIELGDASGRTPVIHATKQGHSAVVRLLVSHAVRSLH